jgi:uncharacterized membrane protein
MKLAGPFIIFISALVLRFHEVGNEALWLDEFATYEFVKEYTAFEIMTILPLIDPHPPFFYLITNMFYEVFGFSEFWLRFPSAAASFISVVMFWILVKRHFGNETALISTALFSVSFVQIQYAQEARSYALLMLLTVISYYLFMNYIYTDTDYNFILFIVIQLLLVLTHYFGIFVLASQMMSSVLMMKFRRNKTNINQKLLLINVTLVTLVGIILFVITQLLESNSATPASSELSLIHILGTFVLFFANGLNSFSYITGLILILIAFAFIYSIRTIFVDYSLQKVNILLKTYSQEGQSKLFILLPWLLLPIMAPILISFVYYPIYQIRFALPSTASFFILLGLTVKHIDISKIKYFLLIFLLVGMLGSYPAYYDHDQKHQWDEVAQFITDDYAGDALVVFNGERSKNSFDTYATDGGYNIASELLDDNIEYVQEYRTVYYVSTHESPDLVNDTLIDITNYGEFQYMQVFHDTHAEHRYHMEIRVYKFNIRD